MQFFFSTHFLNLAFLIFVQTQSNFSSAWHDNQFFFLFFYSFIFSLFEWSTLGNVVFRGWSSSLKHLFSYEDHFERVHLLAQKVVHVICPKERVWLKSVLFVLVGNRVMVQRVVDTIFVSKRGLWLGGFLRNGLFSINVPQGINQSDFRVTRFWDLYFWSLKGFDRFKAVASLDAYQIINYQFPSKIHHFFVAWFLKNSRKSF